MSYVLLGGGVEMMMVAKTTNNDLSIQVYDIKSKKNIKKIMSHFGPIRYLDFNPNNMNFVSASQDGTAKIHYISKIKDSVSNLESFGLSFDDDTILTDDNIKIIDNTNTKILESKTDNKNIKQIYPIGHPLYEYVEKIEDYHINSTKDSKFKMNLKYVVKVSNLPEDVQLKDLWEIFEFYGRIEEHGIKIKKFYNDNVAFIYYINLDSANKAIQNCNKMKMNSCIIDVNLLKS